MTDRVYANLVVATPLTPEGAFARFIGENPNGTWTLSIFDDATGDTGSLGSWDLNLTTLDLAPRSVATTLTNSTAVAITDLATATSTLTFSGLNSPITDVDLTASITHTFNGDLDITLTSPAGTVVTVTTDNAGTNDNVFNGTTWDDSAAIPVTDRVYANLVVATPLTPEGAFGRFNSENPNGTWTLSIFDDATGDVGSLATWSLTISTGAAPITSYCFGDGSGTACPCGNTAGSPSGCLNSTGFGAVLSASGNASVGSDTLVLTATGLTGSGNVAFFFQGTTPSLLGSPFFDGLMCAGGGVVRIGTSLIESGTAFVPRNPGVFVSTLGGVPPGGGKFHYQCFYRNSLGPCGTGGNTTNGVKVIWAP